MVEVKEDESQTRNKTDIPSQDVLAIEAEENTADNIRNRQHLIRDKRGKIGETVRIPIPDVDRARGDLRNILGVILAVEDNNYSIGTKVGKLQQMYSRNQFTICKQSMVAIDDVPESVEVSLRECARKSSCVGGQGYNRCFCNQKCRTKKCKCRNNGKLCNSKCHNSNPCFNKEN
ncbi:hypothetical protein QE152_g38215 [Popillia japonica]|uniref:KRAB-A domain-containing 2-like n=1 Tax=Popillia japonica TaxID=7064 RepID=A0AAW1I7W6_POPJA